MEIFTAVALIIVIFVLFDFKSTLVDKISALTQRIEALQRQVHSLQQTEKPPIEKPRTSAEEIKIAVKPEIKREIVHEEKLPPIIEEKRVEVKDEVKIKVEVEEKVERLSTQKDILKEYVTQKEQKPKITVPKEPQLSFFDKNPDLEKFIGENLINKIGIAILVLGIAFFVKYAISQNWINEYGRTAIGVACGAILIWVAHKLRKTFTAFSSVLVGGGLAVLYFTITIAFHEYHIFSQTVAFIIMVFITGFSVLLSVSYDRKELAILALIGGFTSPFLLSTGEGNHTVLFTYVTILNIGILTLAFFKKWNVLNVLTYIFTIVLFAGWLLFKVVWGYQPPYGSALVFATIFFVLFFLMNIVNNVKENRKFNNVEIMLLLSNTFLYYSAGMFVLAHIENGMYQGLFTAIVAIFNFIFAFSLYKNEKADKTLVYLLIGLVLTFASLAAPIQLDGNHVTMFWASEAVLLLWLSQKSGIKLMKKASVLIMVLMIGSLTNDWKEIYLYHSSKPLNILFNEGFITGTIALVSLFLSIYFVKKDSEEFLIDGIDMKFYSIVLNVLLIGGIYSVLILELRHQLHQHISYYASRDLVIGCFNFAFIICLNLISKIKKEVPNLSEASVLIGLVAILFYPLFYNEMIVNVRNAYLYTHRTGYAAYVIHYVDIVLVLSLLYVCYKNLKQTSFKLKELDHIIMWYICFIFIYIGSAELDNIVVINNYGKDVDIYAVLQQNHKIGFPIFWGICSFIVMIIGMKYKRRDLRIISLTLFLIIILKLFLFDIRGISEGGKIAAFIVLGIILLIVSFMYQKLKKLVLDDDSKNKIDTENNEETNKSNEHEK